MKRRILALLTAVVMAVTLLCTCAAPVAAEGYPLPDDITVYSDAALLVSLAGDPELDVVLYEKNGDTAYAIFNMTDEPRTETLELPEGTLRDVWAKEDASAFAAEVGPHGARLFRLSPARTV